MYSSAESYNLGSARNLYGMTDRRRYCNLALNGLLNAVLDALHA